MVKRKNQWTESKIARYQKEGRGQGELSNYKPWLTIQDVPSSGRAHRIKGWKTNRIHHLLSDLERNYFYLLEWADEVIDIREQYPLNREKTLKISEKKQIKHPIDTTSQTPIVFTTDFFITLRKGKNISYVARTIKPSDNLNDNRIIEKFEIEREYWDEMKVDWGIVTEKEIPSDTVKNIGWLHSSGEMTDSLDRQLISDYYHYLQTCTKTISESLRHFDKTYHLEQGSALSLFKHLLATKKISFDIKTPFNISDSINVLDFPIQEPNEKRLAT
ncbi:TnsA endonuclease N-terminal domain-containing protein [Aquibacillus sp. 3ASR75-11]|uniref:TnsA endonuclease N-terminal domain-containing protein n=1 Tax=Terrihalobacillus insolitus TaxID=2950438 RepID=A0A9X4ANA0_9BACI|nr:TnsA endonuclease N-terminal domain-containing protein [Terrihalobacillus insolitus]MDC3424315.1 TnsA endonuclease N-terminal domain-containing protein [Terrihalobacillus insolitus]